MIQPRTSVALLMAAALVGCATQPSALQGSPIPEVRVFAADYFKPAKPGEATVILYHAMRSRLAFGGGCDQNVVVDDVLVLEMGPSERAELRLPAGKHLFRLDNATFLCPASTTTRPVELAPGERAIYRVDNTVRAGIQIDKVPE